MIDDELPNQGLGKIARYPKEQRDEVCKLIRDGAEYNDIIAVCRRWNLDGLKRAGSNEPVEIPTPVNLTNFKNGKLYKAWLRQQQRTEEGRVRGEFAREIVEKNGGGKLNEAALILAQSQIYDVLEEFDVTVLKERLAAKPEEFAKLVNALVKISGGALDIEKYKEQVRAARESIEGTLQKAKQAGGLTQETIGQIEHELKLL